MIDLLGYVKVLGEALKLANNLTDPSKRKEMYELHVHKKARKALEYAERTYHLLDDTVWDVPHLKKMKEYKKYKYYRKKFFEND